MNRRALATVRDRRSVPLMCGLHCDSHNFSDSVTKRGGRTPRHSFGDRQTRFKLLRARTSRRESRREIVSPQSRYSSWSVVRRLNRPGQDHEIHKVESFFISLHFMSSSDGHRHRNAERPSSRWDLFIVLLRRLNLRLNSSTVGRFVVF